MKHSSPRQPRQLEQSPGPPPRRLPWRSLLVGLAAGAMLWAVTAVVPTGFSGAMPRGSGGFQPTTAQSTTPPQESPAEMVWIPGGEYSMGCADPRGQPFGGPDPMRDARPIHRVSIDGFWMDRTEVTNARFAEFVAATDYVTVAERPPKPEDFPGAPLENLVPGSLVFTPPEGPVPLENHYAWWNYVPGADWRHPTGPGSSIEGHDNDPVVQIAHADADAFALWEGKRLPTEAEWECAARGGRAGNLYPWGNEFRPRGRFMTNTWQGRFPLENTAGDGYAGVAPVGTFPANDYGLHDMSGNVWEWCSDWYRHDTYAPALAAGKPERNPPGPADSFDPQEPHEQKRVLRGGSFLCSEQYCARYIVGTRGKGEPSSGCNHIGFRCVKPRSITSASGPEKSSSPRGGFTVSSASAAP